MTVPDEASSSSRHGRWDPLISNLHALRESAGTPSYDALARRLMEQRVGDGQDEHAARIAKSSVHDTFRFGRLRLNERLIKELVRVMGGEPTDVDAWIAACSRPAPAAPAPPPAPPQAEVTPPEAVEAAGRLDQLRLALACVALNLLGREFVDFFNLPVYLDMTGTAIAAIVLGPWRGAAVGASTNVIGVIGSGWISLPFALVNVVGALTWGYGVRRWRMGRTLPRFFALNVMTAVACTVVAVPIILAFLGPDLRLGHDAITATVADSIDGMAAAISFSNLLTSLSDKLVSGFLALVVVSALPLALRRDVDLVAVDSAPATAAASR